VLRFKCSSLRFAGLVAFFVLLPLAGCAPKVMVHPESILDTPSTAYSRGMAELDAGRPSAARIEFERSVGLDHQFAPGHRGLGLACIESGDLRAAKKAIDRALKLDGSDPASIIAKGRLQLAEGKPEQAQKTLTGALKRDPKNVDGLYWIGKVQEALNLPQDAWDSYGAILALAPGDQRATEALLSLARQAAATKGAPPEYVQVAAKTAITREDLAALLVEELDLDHLFGSAPSAQVIFRPPGGAATITPGAAARPPDVLEGRWSRLYVDKVLGFGLLDRAPDGNFLPLAPISRADFARVLESVLTRIADDDRLPTRFVGTASEFRDVPSDHYALNAIKVVTTRGLMSGDLKGAFNPTGDVSGTEALFVLARLRAISGNHQ
jgi:Tfp pilus assembly protein PilF